MQNGAAATCFHGAAEPSSAAQARGRARVPKAVCQRRMEAGSKRDEETINTFVI
jgi:hypothetical protein